MRAKLQGLFERCQAQGLLVSIVDSISACHAEDLGSIPRRGELALFCYRTTHPKVSGAARCHKRSSESTSAQALWNDWLEIEAGSTAWKAAMLATIPPMHLVDAGLHSQ